MKGKRDEALKATGLVLKLTQPDQMIHAFFVGFYVTVKHRGIGADSHLVHRSRHLKPPLSRNLVPGDQGTRALRKDLGPTTRTTAESRLTKPLDDGFERLLRELHEEVQFDHRECLQVNLRETLPQPFEQIGVV